VVTLTKCHLLAQCSYDGFFKSICQALCRYRKEADNRQDHYEELQPDEVFSRDTPPEAMTLANMCGGAVEPLPLKSH
jgi:hypothetical protein